MDSDCETQSRRIRTKQEDDHQATSGIETLPREIVFDILSKLPISSLVQFKYVCRPWRVITQDPNLVDLYNSRTAEENPCLVFHCDFPIRNQLYFVDFHADKDEKQTVRRIQTPFCSSMPEFDVIGSCHGLLCLSDSLYNDGLSVYNPFTRDYRELPRSIQYPNQEVVFGFGFHPITKEYKVVKIIYYKNGHRGLRNRFRISSSEVQVLTLGSSTWRSLGKVSHDLHRWPAQQVLVHGRLHWVTGPRRHRTGRNLVSFDLGDENFREVPKPDVVGLRRCEFHLFVMRGCLSAAFCVSNGKMEIWVMKEYGVKESWVKELVIPNYAPKGIKQEVIQPPFSVPKAKGKSVRVLCVLRSGEFLLEYKEKSRALVLYNPNSGKFKDLVFQGLPNWFQTVVHVGSLNQIDTLIGM